MEDAEYAGVATLQLSEVRAAGNMARVTGGTVYARYLSELDIAHSTINGSYALQVCC